jgi:hypothetical protein
MLLSLDEAQFYANRLLWIGVPLSIAAGIGTFLLLNFYIGKWVNKLTRQNGNIVGRIFYLLSSNKHPSKFRCTSCTTELENKLCNNGQTLKELLMPSVKSSTGDQG